MSVDFLVGPDQTGIMTTPVPMPRGPEVPAAERGFSSTNILNRRPSGPTASDLPDLGNRYVPLRKLGEGGMGAVYLCEDLEATQRVAVKVLPSEAVADKSAIQRFRKEARLLAEVRHPHVANLIDAGNCGSTCFLVMELVEGTDLKQLVQALGALPVRAALRITHDIASALGVAHARGIVHRDLKPANILLSAIAAEGESPADAVRSAVAGGQVPTARLTDFGLARHIDQGASLDLTKTGALLGTPYYISPEQCTDRGGITPAADIYSLGATLFELLAGRPPFKADDPVKLISMHCFEQAPDLRRLNPDVSDGIADLVAKCLQKNPADRYADAEHLRADLERLLRGDTTSAAIHPIVPAARGKVFETTWEWDLDGQATDLWPLVSNTERINAAVGLPPVEYVTRRDARGEKHRIGSFRLGWAKLAWEEHPFEWIEGRRLGVLRQFENGPFDWFLSIVELVPRPTGGSQLRHTVRIATKGWLGRLLAHIEVNVKGRKPLDRIYRRIDDVVTGRLGRAPALDPFSPPAQLSSPTRKRLAALRSRLVEQNVDLRTLEALLNFLAESPAQELARIRPRALARRLGCDADPLTALCLEACHVGLLELHWDVLCPTCRVAADVKESLSAIDRHTHCEACEANFDVDFDKSVEMIFRVHPEFRQADLKTYCIGGPEHAPHVVAQTRLAPGERLELDLSLDPGGYVLRGPQLAYTVSLLVDSAPGTGRADIVLHPSAAVLRPIRLPAGRQLLTLVNDHATTLVCRIERTVQRGDAVTAADAMRLPAFRRLFPSETFTRERLSNLATCTLVGVRIANAMDLYSAWGDARTCEELGRTLALCRTIIESQGGKLVKDEEESLLASFPRAAEAARAAVELQRVVAPAATASELVPELRIALHRGMAMATSLNGRQDLFGRSVALARRLLDSDAAPGTSIVLSDELAGDEEVRELLSGSGLDLARVVTNPAASPLPVPGTTP